DHSPLPPSRGSFLNRYPEWSRWHRTLKSSIPIARTNRATAIRGSTMINRRRSLGAILRDRFERSTHKKPAHQLTAPYLELYTVSRWVGAGSLTPARSASKCTGRRGTNNARHTSPASRVADEKSPN